MSWVTLRHKQRRDIGPVKLALSELNDLLGKFLASICPRIIDVKSCLEGSQAVPNVVCTHRVRGTAVDPGLKEGEGPFSPSFYAHFGDGGKEASGH